MIKKELQARLEQDENAWLKTQVQLGDFAREILRAHERISNLERRLAQNETKETKQD
jgi:hypothetical protein